MEILIVYYSRNGSVAQLARLIARGVEEVDGMRARLRQVPPVAAITQSAHPPVPDEGAPYEELKDLHD
jgi:NAD(P)H dehydrogenase (quinone)